MTVWRMRIACRYLRLQNAHSEYVMRSAFPLNSSCTNAPKSYVIRTLISLFTFYVYVVINERNTYYENLTPPLFPLFPCSGTAAVLRNVTTAVL